MTHMKKYLIGNWKSHKNASQAEAWVLEFDQALVGVVDPEQTVVAVCPPYPLLGSVQAAIGQASPRVANSLKIGIQDLSPFPLGKYTGEVAVGNMKGFDIEYAILGHSERRRYFQEDHHSVAQKVDQALQAGIVPIVCVDDEYAQAQAQALPPDQAAQCVVAYEPVEAIGSGHNQPVHEVKPIVQLIKAEYGEVPVLYGGSVDVSNVAEYLSITNGVLVGGASLKADEFVGLVQAANIS